MGVGSELMFQALSTEVRVHAHELALSHPMCEPALFPYVLLHEKSAVPSPEGSALWLGMNRSTIDSAVREVSH